MRTPDPDATASEPRPKLFDRIAEAIDRKIDALAGKLNAFTDRLQQGFHRQADSEPDTEDAPERRRAEEPADEPAPATNGRSAARRLRILAYVGAAAVAVATGGAGVFYVLSDRIAQQAAELSRQSSELEARNQALKDSEKRYLDQQLDLVKTETRLARTLERLELEARRTAPGSEPASTETAARLTELPRITVTRTAAHGTPDALPGGKCVVSEDNLSETLRGCLHVLNGQP